MAVTLNIPDDVATAIKWPRKQLDHQLAIEMAYALYGRGLASMGTARRLAGLDMSLGRTVHRTGSVTG